MPRHALASGLESEQPGGPEFHCSLLRRIRQPSAAWMFLNQSDSRLKLRPITTVSLLRKARSGAAHRPGIAVDVFEVGEGGPPNEVHWHLVDEAMRVAGDGSGKGIRRPLSSCRRAHIRVDARAEWMSMAD
jgi:hypothetical protein